MSIHVEDCDGCFEYAVHGKPDYTHTNGYAEDAGFWMFATNGLFKTEKQPGIKA